MMILREVLTFPIGPVDYTDGNLSFGYTKER